MARKRALAQGRALRRLKDMAPDVYARLYREEVAKIDAETDGEP